MGSVVDRIRKDCGLPDLNKRNKLKEGLFKVGVVGAGLVGVSSMASAAPSIFWRDEAGTLTDLKGGGTGSVTRVISIEVYNSDLTIPIIVGTTSYARVPFDCTITGWYLTETSETPVSGSIVVDVWKDTSGNYPPTSADSIAGSEKPTLVTQAQNSDTTLTTWTTSLNTGDYIGIYVDSNNGCKRIELQLVVTT